MRIFWLGMHKLLTRTELPRLRQLGYEVFNPPYLSPVPDQSANLAWDTHQPTTLPRDVFDKLSRTNFYYDQVSPEVGELLNAHFDVMIVTIHPGWLHELLRVFRGKVIFRTYGQIEPLSDHLFNFGTLRLVTERPDFWFVPHSPLTAASEHAWLRDRCVPVPYHLGQDALALTDTWAQGEHKPEIMAVCPNIDNIYYRHHYLYLKRNFPQRYFRFYGVQMRSDIEDPQIVGTLPRERHLQAYKQSAGLLYTYTERDVCYLPPIEMMVAGGPVVFMPGSLLDRYFGGKAPGRAQNEDEAHAKTRRLLAGDSGYINEVIASQGEVRKLYTPEHVNPLFDETFARLLKPETRNTARPVVLNAADRADETQKRIYIYDHYPHRSIKFENGSYIATDGIPRVMRRFCHALLKHTKLQVVITAYASEAANVHGFFTPGGPDSARLRIMPVEGDEALPARPGMALPRGVNPHEGLRHRVDVVERGLKEKLLRLGLTLARRGPRIRRLIIIAGQILLRGLRFARKVFAYVMARRGRLRKKFARLQPSQLVPPAFRGFLYSHTDRINADAHAVGIINPHYYFFMDSLTLEKPLALYLPDYIPHFYKETGEFNVDAGLARVARYITQKAQVVFTNSHFSAGYLPRCDLKVDAAKIRVFPLPQLNTGTIEHIDEAAPAIAALRAQLRGRPFLFYPTQNRPNKNIAMLLRATHRLSAEFPDLQLVLTGHMDHFEPAKEVFDQLNLEARTIFARGIDDETVAWLYRNCACLAFSSNMEGNFPTQIYEALNYGAPIVGTELPMITEKLAGQAENLPLVTPEDTDAFAAAIAAVLRDRAGAIAKQQKVAAYIRGLDEEGAFAAGAVNVVRELAGEPLPAASSEAQPAEGEQKLDEVA
ncbi:MAG: glycosyltransferase [Alphaproteobacteria bacterium]|nr:glycosyltransferase [Alphaproteobacteria bacterium]